MTVAIGGTWVAARGPASLRELCIRCLELGFDGMVPAPGPRPVRWADLRQAIEDLPLDVPAVRVDPLFTASEGTLASTRADDVLAVRARVELAASVGRAVRSNLLLLEAPRVPLPGGVPQDTDLANIGAPWTPDSYRILRDRLLSQRDRVLDLVCRSLHRLAGDLPEFRLCLTESSDLSSLSEAADLELILGDLRSRRVGYWHRPAVVARRAQLGGTAPGPTLDSLHKFLSGSDLSDVDASGLQALPGAGGVDYPSLAPYIKTLHSKLPTVLEPDTSTRDTDLKQARGFLGKFGL